MNLLGNERAMGIEALVLDVDGVLTDGGLIYGPEGEWKRFDVQDGHGISMARKAGIKVGILTGRTSAAATRRAAELGVEAMMDGVRDKGKGLTELAGRLGVEPSTICFVGDDLVDLPAMRRCGVAVAVANAVPEVKAQAAAVTTRSGGCGAVREVVEWLLRGKGVWADMVDGYMKDSES
ncbi:MAG TPA: HAD-IIIA family hydrolase [Kiritimatiellia bacterium]|nr:HAD-IIIA family hydrolase [Kiritimatiellia bacterium]